MYKHDTNSQKQSLYHKEVTNTKIKPDMDLKGIFLEFRAPVDQLHKSNLGPNAHSPHFIFFNIQDKHNRTVTQLLVSSTLELKFITHLPARNQTGEQI